jgi:hypothetical protein
MAYRVDNVPALWRPFWLAYSWIVGIGFWCVWNLLVLTCSIRFEGEQHHVGRENYIYSLWHESWFLYFAAFARSHRLGPEGHSLSVVEDYRRVRPPHCGDGGRFRMGGSDARRFDEWSGRAGCRLSVIARELTLL